MNRARTRTRLLAGAGIAGALAAIAMGGCSSSPSPAAPDAGCYCGVTVNEEHARIACGETACVSGTVVNCDADSGPYTAGACFDGGPFVYDGSSGGEAGCKLICNGTNCGPDGCGGMCRCPLGIQCRASDNSCGGGGSCTLTLGKICSPNSTDPNKCCGSFYACETRAGGSACCSNRLGPCKFASDCCGKDPLCESGKCQ